MQGVLSTDLNSIDLMRRLGFRLERGRHGDPVGVLDS